MKKLLVLLCFSVAMLIFSGCTPVSENETSSFSSTEEETVSQTKVIVPANDSVISSTPLPSKENPSLVQGNENEISTDSEIRAVWLAIYEIAPSFSSTDEEKYKQQIEDVMENLKAVCTTDIFLQVRANCDSIYPSQYFKPNSAFQKDGRLRFDALKIIIDCAHESNIKVHAWINPYRISATDGVDEDDPIFRSVENDDIYTSGKKAYLKPVSDEARRLVLNGIREILSYDVDGIHIDDYFYPTSEKEIDESEYSSYINAGGTLSLSDWRRANVSSLVSSIYSLVKSSGTGRIFSISPAADIDKNRDTLYADVELWSSTAGYADMIIPQIYFGFENESQPYKKCLDRWVETVKCDSVRLVVGLSVYKSGQDDSYAGSGKDEWKENSDIIKREVEYLREKDCAGYALFSYHHMLSESCEKEMKNLSSLW